MLLLFNTVFEVKSKVIGKKPNFTRLNTQGTLVRPRSLAPPRENGPPPPRENGSPPRGGGVPSTRTGGSLTLGGGSLTLRNCCSRILLLFCCYCSTLQHCSAPNVRQLYLRCPTSAALPLTAYSAAFTEHTTDRDLVAPRSNTHGSECALLT